MYIPNKQDIEPIMTQFDFEKVQKCMALVNWKWTSIEPPGVPTVDQLKECVRKLWEQVCKSKGGSCRTGGFEVYAFNEEEASEIGIRFWLERAFDELPATSKQEMAG